ncbi:MAG: RNA 2',3'-cyclic phosphodiesterase [Minisyncoccia bacterium]
MKKRLFIGIPITKGLYQKIANLEDDIDKRLNWIPLKNLHLTILFLGNIDINEIPEIIDMMDEVKIKYKEYFKKLNLKIKKIDYGPPGRKNMIWLYIEKDEKLDKIKKIFEDELEKRKIYFQREERDFLPHINLIRLKNKKNLGDIKKDLDWSLIFTEINLYESHLKKPFVEYEVIKTIELI